MEQYRTGKITYNGQLPNLEQVGKPLYVRGKEGKWLAVPPENVLIAGAPMDIDDDQFVQMCTSFKVKQLVPFDGKYFNFITVIKITGLAHSPNHTPGAFVSLAQDPRLLFKLDLENIKSLRTSLFKKYQEAQTAGDKIYPAIMSSYLCDNVLTKPTEKEKKEMTTTNTLKPHLRFLQMMQSLYSGSDAKDAYDERGSYRFTADKAMKLGWSYAGKYDVEQREFVAKSSRKRPASAPPTEIPGSAVAGEKEPKQPEEPKEPKGPEERELGLPISKRGRKGGTNTSTSTASAGAAASSSSSATVTGSAIQVDFRSGGILEVLLPGKRMSFSALPSGDYTWAVKDAPAAGDR